MVTWSEIRGMIVERVRQTFPLRGFKNPGVTTWRYRPDFIDVIQFRCTGQGYFSVEFGCDIRQGSRQNPRPQHCAFRVHPSYAFGWHQAVSFAFQDSQREQQTQIEQILNRVHESAEFWFHNFQTLDVALRSLQHNQSGTPRHVTVCSPGSIAFVKVQRRLEIAMQNRTLNRSGGPGGVDIDTRSPPTG